MKVSAPSFILIKEKKNIPSLLFQKKNLRFNQTKSCPKEQGYVSQDRNKCGSGEGVSQPEDWRLLYKLMW